MTTQYNPYSHIQNDLASGIVSAFDAGVSTLNSLIRTGATNGNYTVADVYTAFKDSELNPCNAYFNGQNDFNLDFHPNTDGHQLIAETIKKLGIMNPNGVTASCDTYDRNGFDPVTYTLSHPDSVRFTELKAGGRALTPGTDYTISGDVITLEDSYLEQQEEGTTLNLSFCFDTGEPATASLKIPKTYKITINSDPVNVGYFSANGYSNGESVYYVTQGKEVELSAEAYSGYQFTAWKKDDVELSSETFYTFTPTEDCTLTMVYELLPASLGVSPSELDFGVLDPPYTQPEARIVTITNTGETLLGLFQPESEHYEIGELSIYLLDPGETTTFTVRPAAGLEKGNYDETINVYATRNVIEPNALTLAAQNDTDSQEAEVLTGVHVSFQVGKDTTAQAGSDVNSSTIAKSTDTPKTGDNNHAAYWLLLLLVSSIGAGTYFVVNKRKKINR